MINARISSARQAVHRADSFTGFGKRPAFTPSHQHVLPTGITLSTCGRRRNPVSGMSCMLKTCLFSQLLIVTRLKGRCLGESHWEPVSAMLQCIKNCPILARCFSFDRTALHRRTRSGESASCERGCGGPGPSMDRTWASCGALHDSLRPPGGKTGTQDQSGKRLPDRHRV